MPRHDLHQHLWPEPLIAALARRREMPRMRCDAARRWRVELQDEPVSEVDPGTLGTAVAHALLEHNPQQALGSVAMPA